MASSIRKETARALGVDYNLIPERLRNRLNGYVKNETIPAYMVDEVPADSESHQYTPKPITSGNHTYLKNLVFLDTLFDDTKIVKGLILNQYDYKKRRKCLEDFQRESIARLDLLKSMLPMLDSVLDFLAQDNIDWNQDELPYPYTDSQLLSANLNQSFDLSIYDQALKSLLNKDLKSAHQLLQEHPTHFANADSMHLKCLIEQRYAEYQEYAEYLASFE